MDRSPGRHFLQIPGPTNTPLQILAAIAKPTIGHRSAEFASLGLDVLKRIRSVFKTENPVVIFPTSGTGAWEAALVNTLSPGDRVLMFETGWFSTLWSNMAKALGLQAEIIPGDWRSGVKAEEIEARLRADVAHTYKAVAAALEAHPKARAVYVQASETSTCVLHPVPAIAEITRARDVLLVVDGITAVGALDLPMDRLGIDALITGSQKGLMLPPGLAFIALSARAWAAVQRATLPRFYFDLARERKGVAERSTAWTPAISLIQGLRVALAMMRSEGLPNVYARHDRLARATRAGAAAIGLQLLAPDAPSPAGTAVCLPGGVDGSGMFRYLRDRMRVTFAGGQDQLKGKIIRVAHLGYVGSFDIVTGLAALELALRHFGAPVELGRGVGAAEAILAEGLPPR